MEPVSFGLTVCATADICVRYGRLLVSKYRAYKNAEKEINELTLCLEHHWITIDTQVAFLRGIWHSIGDTLQDHQNRILVLLQGKLQEAILLVDSVIGDPDNETTLRRLVEKKGILKRRKFALSVKDCLKKIIDELEEWHRKFDPSWFLILRISGRDIDQQLSTQQTVESNPISTLRSLRDTITSASDSVGPSIFISTEDLFAERVSIPFSSAQISRERGNGREVIVDTIGCNSSTRMTTTTKDIRNLARILTKMDPFTFGLLACRGVVKLATSAVSPATVAQTAAAAAALAQTPKYEFVFAIPEGLRSPKCLRSLLIGGDKPHSLNERLQLARQLANSVMFIHTSQFVHKNIRPETIIVFENENSTFAAPFLVGFERFRSVDGRTCYMGDSLWEQNLYRHPSRQGSRPEEDYQMQHDIYSLGVCLLEIGLWSSFVLWAGDINTPCPGPELDIADKLPMKDLRKRAFDIKRILVAMANDRLPGRMGARYTNVVVSCLTSLDQGNQAFGDQNDFEDEDGVLVGVRYIEKILLQIQEICM